MAVDYDPVKAHAYYEKHKKLKGRRKGRSTKGWNDTQKAQLEYAKDQLKTEHKENNADISEDAKAKRKALSEAASQRIKAIRAQLKYMSPEQKEILKGRIQGIRDQLAGQKEDLKEQTSEKRAAEKESYEGKIDQAYATIRGMKKKK